jgi:hypothetical protein
LLTLKYTNIFEKFRTALFINAIELSFPYKRHKESFESLHINFIINKNDQDQYY